MNKMIVTCGIAGCGKTTWANAQNDFVVLDSDAIREELWGDANDQRNPRRVFRLMQERAIEALRAHKNVIYCATNLYPSKRISLLQNMREKLPDVSYECVVFDVPLEQALVHNHFRARRVPVFAIKRQYDLFMKYPPHVGEGWDLVQVMKW